VTEHWLPSHWNTSLKYRDRVAPITTIAAHREDADISSKRVRKISITANTFRRGERESTPPWQTTRSLLCPGLVSILIPLKCREWRSVAAWRNDDRAHFPTSRAFPLSLSWHVIPPSHDCDPRGIITGVESLSGSFLLLLLPQYHASYHRCGAAK
jgi:hypothetical protein